MADLPPSPESLIDDLACRTVIEDGDKFTMVTIPEFDKLSESQRLEVYNKARQLHTAKAIAARLQSMTPPVDEDETNEEGRQLEAKARKELEDDGCPPCYPPELDIPLRNRDIPQDFEAIVKYWLVELRTDDVVLCAQASDWREFRNYQLYRSQFRNKHFDEFIDKIRERRRRHGLSDDFRLLPDPKQQGRLETWIEFEDYHLKKLEQTEAKRDLRKQRIEDARKLSSDSNISEGERERARENAERGQLFWEGDIKKLIHQRVLLDWIDHQRQMMDSTPFKQEINNGHRYNLRTSARDNRKQTSKASIVLGQAKVTKVKSKKQNRPIQKLKQSKIPNHQLDALDHQRQMMDSESFKQEINNGHRYNLRKSARGNRKQTSKTSTVLGQAKVTKVKPKKQNRPIQKLKQPKISNHQLDAQGETKAKSNTSVKFLHHQLDAQEETKAKSNNSVKPVTETQRRGTS